MNVNAPVNHASNMARSNSAITRVTAGLSTALLLGSLGFSALAKEAVYSNPVLPGDYPDPTIMRLGDEYWASATSSDWAPLFPLFRSRDLVNWTLEGNVFPQRPSWTEGKFWAPEICEYKGKIYVYYVAQQAKGALSIGVATADKPTGPYTDHGPIVTDPVGAIDPHAITGDDGQRYLVWKLDGNARKEATPIYIQKLTQDGLKLDGPRTELIRNDASWEGALIEGPFVMKHGDWWYIFFAGGNGCCGHRCQYGTGVARSKNLTGPYEKCPSNPVLAANETWKCPGHGSLVQDTTGRTFFIYHAYSPKGFHYIGRQGMIDEVTWSADGWPVISKAQGPSHEARAPFQLSSAKTENGFLDEFTGSTLHPRWNWPQASEPKVQVTGCGVKLAPAPHRATNVLGAIMGVRTTDGNYTATTLVDLNSLTPGQAAGLCAVGNSANTLGILARDGKVQLLRRQKGKQDFLVGAPLGSAKAVYLRIACKEGHRYRFSYWTAEQPSWRVLGGDAELEGDFLPPWDLGVRVSLTSGGAENGSASFKWMRVVPGLVD